MAQKYGANEHNLRGMFGVNSYETAWSWLQKLRRAMVCPDRDRLLGVVEVDEMYVSRPEQGVHEQANAAESLFVHDFHGSGHGRLRLRLPSRPLKRTTRQPKRSSWPPGEDTADGGSRPYIMCQVAYSEYPL